MDASVSLESRLAAVLPKDVRIRAYHISTPPSATEAIFSAPPGQKEQQTQCESHFLGISSPQEANESEVFVFAIEVLIFTTDSLTTVFISKADSSGFISRLHPRQNTPSIPQTITKAFLDHLLAPRLSDVPLVLSLFARSQHSYLFPGSKHNAQKHILDDRQLIKWWCKVLDSIWRPYDDAPSHAANNRTCTITAHVVVPGCDKSETRVFFPRSSSQDPISAPKWIASYPMQQLALDDDLPLRCLIPRLPDDPKSRFLKDLDGNSMDSEGQWRSLRTIDQFWEMMSYRQECSAGRLVGFVWIVFSPDKPEPQGTSNPLHTLSFSSEVSAAGPLPTPVNSQRPTTGLLDDVSAHQAKHEQAVPPSTPPPSSPLLEPDEEGTTGLVDTDGELGRLTGGTTRPAEYVAAPDRENSQLGEIDQQSKSPGQVVVTAIDYEILIEDLLELDFAGPDLASQSTSKWLEEISSKVGTPQFGVGIVGTAEHLTSQKSEPNSMPQANTLTAVRKKRKVADDRVEPEAMSKTTTTPQNLPSSLVRKKPKINGGC